MEDITYLGVVLKTSSDHPRYEAVVNYCFELSGLHAEFVWILDWLERSYGFTSDMEPPESPLGLIYKKFLVAHTWDDFCFRLYAYQEKVYQLINAVFDIGLSEKDPKQRESIRNWLENNNELELRKSLRFFKDNKVIREMIEHRQGLTHRLAKYEIQILSQVSRYFEWLSWDPELDTLGEKDEVDVVVSTFRVDDLYQQIKDKLERVKRDVSKFGHRLCADILNSLKRGGFLKES